jgi:transcriptional regulator with XRE-family HTH domain
MEPGERGPLKRKNAKQALIVVSAPRRNVGRTTQTAAPEEAEVKIGLRIKHARLVKGLRLRELAETLDCSESFLSKVENDRVRPSLAMLHKIVGALGINIPSLFTDTVEPIGPVLIVTANNRALIRTNTRLHGPGVALERLIAGSRSQLLEANVHCIEPGGHTEGVYTHEGEELGYLLEGQLQLQVDGVWYTLSAGDSFFFRSNLPHGYRNRGSKPAKVLWVNTPPTF